jgi:tRNA(His) 5'-end guanylyltransferase
MEFKTLEDRMLYYRSQTNYVLTKKSYVMIMLDGKNFSSKIKKKFALPFDDTFIDIMNRTAEFVCSQIQGSKLAYVQSDEISKLC